MPQAGDSFSVTLPLGACNWGDNPPRKTTNRNIRSGEAYIPIPRNEAQCLAIFNSNQQNANTTYTAVSSTGQAIGELKAEGCTKAGDVYAKQFAGDGNLQVVGQWFHSIGAQAGGTVRVTFTSPTTMELEYIP